MDAHRTSCVLWIGLITVCVWICPDRAISQTSSATAIPSLTPVVTITIPEQVDYFHELRQLFQEHGDYSEPVPMPDWQMPEGLPGDDREVMIHNTITGETISRRFTDDLQALFDYVPGNSGGLVNNEMPERDERSELDNYTELYEVTNPRDFPWRTACKLLILNDDTTYIGSGMLIDPKHVITAGHCVYDYPNSRWVEQVQVIPAYDNLFNPYGDGISVSMLTWSAWINSGDGNHDMGIIELDRPVGAITGWHGYGYNNSDDWFYTRTWDNPSYPGCLENGEQMYNWYGTVDAVLPYLLQVNRLGCAGMSGCAAYTNLWGSNIVYSNGSHQSDSLQCHWQCRITQSKYGIISDYISDHQPVSLDLVSLDCNSSPGTRQAGEQLTTFDHLIHNYSTASWSGLVTANAYLSDDDVITTGDVFLASGSIDTSYTPLSSVRVNWQVPPTIPSNTLQGSYRLGVIVSFEDINFSNNITNGADTSPIWIAECPGIASPPMYTPAHDTAACMGYWITFSWSSLISASSYRIQWDTDMQFTSPDEATTTDTSTIRNFMQAGHHYWRVRGERSCREGPWSSIHQFDIVALPPPPVPLTPGDGYTICRDVPEPFCWSPVEGVTNYRVQWDVTDRFFNPIEQNTSDTCVTQTLTGGGQWHWRVSGANACGYSAWVVRSVFLDDLTPPEIVLSINDRLVGLRWELIPCAASYLIESTDDLTEPFDSLGSTPGVTFFVDTTEAKQFYRVTALR